MSEPIVDLGFLDKCEPWLLKNRYFPSKVGGLPAWLNLESIPSNDILKCGECNNQLLFLCQVYAPLDEYERCFHRTIYVFICTDPNCWKPNESKSIKVLRCQLPQNNKFYDPTPPNEDVQSEEIPPWVKICQVCGCRGPLSCGKCRSVSYCSAAHQKIDWTLGEHKASCTVNKPPHHGNKNCQYLLEEFDLVTEPEELEDDLTENLSESEKETRRMKEYDEFLRKQREKQSDVDLKDVPDEEFEKYTNQVDDDEVFFNFKKRVDLDSDQVLRFDRGGKTLWITNRNILDSKDIPNCELCQSPRIFEFQIMPQLLNSLKSLNVDWGVIPIYTCENSCDTNDAYVPEFCYKQDIVSEESNKQ